MSYEKVTMMRSRIIIGKKQTLKAIKRNEVSEVYYARDADAQLIQEVIRVAQERNIPCHEFDSMKRLGAACGIEVAASTVAVKR